MSRVFVVGVGVTQFASPGKLPGDYPDWGKEAILEALGDAKLRIEDIDVAVAGYMCGDSASGQRVIYQVGMTGIPIFNINNMGSTGSTALMVAKELLGVDGRQCALAVGFEKMQRGGLVRHFSDRAHPGERIVAAMVEKTGELTLAPMTAQIFGNAGLEHMRKYGTKAEHFAKIAVKNHKHSVDNPKAQYRDEYTLEQILNSPVIFGPLTKLQCSPTSDGAAAAILATEQFVLQHNLQEQAIEILGMEMATDLENTFESGSLMSIAGYDMTKHAAQKLYKNTGINPSEVQVIELHDCFSTNELITYEALGLCPPGKGGEMVDRGDNTYGGKFVINPSGGLIARGHPIGACGIAQCAEICWQLRGVAGPRQVKGARLALQHTIGLGGAVVVALYRHWYTSNIKSAVGRNLKVLHIGKIIEDAVSRHKNLIIRHQGLYKLTIVGNSGKTESWFVSVKPDGASVKNNSDKKADAIITVEESDLSEILDGRISLREAYSQGKIGVSGKMSITSLLVRISSRL